MPRQLRVFLCHASQDKPAVRKIYTYLKQHGIQPWLDQENLLPGQDWEVEIPKALFNSDVILVCISKNSVNKEGYVQKEIAFALDKSMEKPEGTIFIIPVKLEECDVPKRLSRYQWVDYYRTDGRKRLLLGLNVRAQGLGDEIIPVVMEDSKQRMPRPLTPTPETQQEVQAEEETKKEISSISPDMQSERKLVQRKPFTKILDPSSLNPSKTLSTGKNNQKLKPTLKQNYRWVGIVGIVLLLFVLGGYGLNSLFNKPPEATSTPTLQLFAETLKPPMETTVPLTPTLTDTPDPSPTPTTVLGIGSTSKSLKDGMVLVYVPAGEFTMGSNDGNEDEKPEHQVYLDAYWIDQTEVTNAMYAKCVEANQCDFPGKNRSKTRVSYFDNSEFKDYPVVYVSWENALAYCSWVGRTLPTEEQWEKAARGVDGRIYPWGNVSPKDTLLNYDNVYEDTTKVGSFPNGASIYGVYDMAGNVWEWVSDWYNVYPGGDSSLNNYFGQKFRVLRGGSFTMGSFYVSTTHRNFVSPIVTDDNLGFRCLLSKP